eukprot:gene16422-22636_t
MSATATVSGQACKTKKNTGDVLYLGTEGHCIQVVYHQPRGLPSEVWGYKTYSVATSKTCEDWGLAGIYDKDECVKAIDATPYSMSSGPHEGGSGVVDGCSMSTLLSSPEYVEDSMGLTSIYDDDECTKALEDKDYWPLVWGPYGRFPDTVDGCSIRFGNNAFRNDKGQCKVGTKTPDWIPGEIISSKVYTDLKAYSWQQAKEFCVSKGADLCKAEAYCPGGPGKPPSSTLSIDKKADIWSPTSDQDNEWVSLTDKFGDNRLCIAKAGSTAVEGTTNAVRVGNKFVVSSTKAGRFFLRAVNLLQSVQPGGLKNGANIVKRIIHARTGKAYKVVLLTSKVGSETYQAMQNYRRAYAEDFAAQTSVEINNMLDSYFVPATALFLKEAWSDVQMKEMAAANGWQIADTALAAASIVDITGILGVVSAYAKPICGPVVAPPCRGAGALSFCLDG